MDWDSIAQDSVKSGLSGLTTAAISSLMGNGSGMGKIKTGIRYGAKYDLKTQKNMFDYRINQGLEHGMTPYEMFMGPAAGAGGGSSGSNQVLGNAASNQELLKKQQSMELVQKQLDRQTQLQTAKIQADASRDVAGIQAGVSREKIAVDWANHALTAHQYFAVDLPKAAYNLQMSAEELKKKVNEVITSSPKFITMQKLLSMGVDNSINYMIQSRFGIDITDPKEMQSLSDDKFRNILGAFLAAGSQVSSITEGIRGLLEPESGGVDFTPLGYEDSGVPQHQMTNKKRPGTGGRSGKVKR
jgi:hypothetical protein